MNTKFKMNLQLFADDGDNIEKLFDTPVILDYLKEKQYPAMLGQTLFPEKKIQGLELEYIKGASNVPVMASVHAFDTEAEIASRDAFGKVKEKIALVKRKIRMDEELIIRLNKPRDDQEKQYAVNKFFDDVDNMVTGVLARAEAMRMEALSSGKIAVNENDVKLTVEYGMPENHQNILSGTDLWTDAGSDPLQDIYDMVDTIVADTGTTPSRALTSRSVLNALLRHATIKKAIHGVNYDKIVTKEDLNQLLESMDLPKVATYDSRSRVQQEDGTYLTQRYFPEDKFVVFPDGILGHTVYGLTAEEIELSKRSDIDMSKVGNIIACVYSTIDPVAKWTKAVATVLPSFPAANEVFIAKVK